MKCFLEIDTDRNEWLLDYVDGSKIQASSKLGKKLNNILRVGYNIISNIDTSVNITMSDNNTTKVSDTMEDIADNIDIMIENKLNKIDKNYKEYIKNNQCEFNNYSKSINEDVVKVKNLLEFTNSTISQFMTKSTTVVNKGKVGEAFVEEAISSHFKNLVCNNVAGTAHKGDLLIEADGYNIIVECKNYSNTVPLKEVKKLHNDMVKNNVKYGIMVSLNSKIVGKKQFDIEKISPDGDMYVLYCSNVGDDECSIVWSIMIIQAFHKILSNSIKSKKVNKLAKFSDMIHNLQELLSDIDKCSDGWDKFCIKIQKTIKDYNKMQVKLIEHKTTFVSNYLKTMQQIINAENYDSEAGSGTDSCSISALD